MLVNHADTSTESAVKFVSYSGEYPNLCRGTLVLNIDGKDVIFSSDYYKVPQHNPEFWSSGGSCGFTNGYSDSYVHDGEWEIDVDMIPEEYRKYATEIDAVFNANVRHGCCGGCL